MARKLKQTQIPWLGEIPDGWVVRNFTNIFDTLKGVKEKQIQKSEYDDNGSIPIIDQGQDLIVGYTNKSEKVVNDLPLIIFGDHTRIIKYIDFPFSVGADGTQVLKAIIDICYKFEYYVLSSLPIQNLGYSRHFKELKLFQLPLPPLDEQEKIARFLDEKCVAVDELVKNTKEAIVALKEMKKSIITEAVTGRITPHLTSPAGGEEQKQSIPHSLYSDNNDTHLPLQNDNNTPHLTSPAGGEGQKKSTPHSLYSDNNDTHLPLQNDNNTPYSLYSDNNTPLPLRERLGEGLQRKLKPTNIPWLGEIPEGWGVKRLKEVCELRNEKASSFMQYIALENIKSWDGLYIPSTEEIKSEGVNSLFYNGDILFSKLRPYLAKAIIAEFSGMCSSELLVLHNLVNCMPKFLLKVILSDWFINIVDSSTYGAKMPRANWNFICEMQIPLPPLEEQEVIAKFLDEKCGAVDEVIAKKEEMINKSLEFKKSLIYEYVSGKKHL
jgi:restriction endonuclease S subunit